MADTLYFNVKFHDALPGNAGADIEISIPQAVMASLAWADETGKALESCLPIRLVPLSDGKASYTLRDGLLIPEQAKTLICRVYNDCGHEIVLPELRFDIPESKQLAAQTPKKVFFATSDIHVGGRYFHNDENRRAAFSYIAGVKPEAVLISGDITDNSYPEEFAEAQKLLAESFAGIPVFVCTGNHDYSPYKPGATPHFAEMHAFFEWQCAHDNALGVKTDGLTDKNYFEGRLPDGTQVLVLNANDVNNHFEVGEAQRAWLDKKLCESDGQIRFVLTHYHQKGTVGCSAERFGMQFVLDDAELTEIFNRHPGLIHVSGHTHYNFDSDMPNASYDSEHDVLYLNAGCAVWNGVDFEQRREYYLQDRCTGQQIELYDGYSITRGVDFVSGKYIPRSLSLQRNAK